MSAEPDPTWNHLLRALPDAERERWSPHLEPVEMPLGTVLCESGATLAHVYFPTTAIVSLLYMMESGASAEIAMQWKLMAEAVGRHRPLSGHASPRIHPWRCRRLRNAAAVRHRRVGQRS